MAEVLKFSEGKFDEKDSRQPCKYGNDCYQKNPKHHEKFKHPKRKAKEDEIDNSTRQRPKLDNSDTECNKDKTVVDKNSGSDDRPASPVNDRDYIQEKFLIKMPEDFYSFWEFCKEQTASAIEDFQKVLCLRLVGPFDVLSGKLKCMKKTSSDYLRHWRYYFDPPEFQTVLAGDDDSQFHIGYFRDDPKEMPVFVASNKASENCRFQIMGPNLFSAINSYIGSLLKQSKQETSKKWNLEKIKSFQSQLQSWANDHDFSLDITNPNLKARSKKIVTKTFHGAGLVVPVDKKTEVGYRPLPETDANLRKILKKIVDSKTEEEKLKNFDLLQEIITLIQFANDECDYGMGLELGMDLFLFGSSDLHSAILNILPLAYELLNRPQFSKIIQAHLLDRRKSKPLNLLAEK